MAINSLPRYPSSRAREALSPSQLATLNSVVSTSLAQILALPLTKRDSKSVSTFISTYARDHAQCILQDLIWGAGDVERKPKPSKVERTIRQRTLLLVEAHATQLDLQTLIDISIIYGSTSPKRTRALLAQRTDLAAQVEADAVSAFAALLFTPTQGLYGLRKTAHVLLAFLRAAPAPLVRPFARAVHFMRTLASTYDGGLGRLAQAYGGVRPERLAAAAAAAQELDDWERIFLETKVALADAFHVLVTTLLRDVADSEARAGSDFAVSCEAAFKVVFALLDLPGARPSTDDPTPFVNQPLLADYQHVYDLSGALAKALRRADDARADLLESALRSLDAGVPGQSQPSVLRLLVRGSGVPPGIDNLGKGPSKVEDKGKGKGKGKAVSGAPQPAEDPALDAAVAQVLDVLPEQPPEYVRFVLSHPDYPYRGDAERLIGALLEGAAPSIDEVEGAMAREVTETEVSEVVAPQQPAEQFEFTKERRNIFDDQQMDLSHVRVGKKRDDAATLLQDRTFIEQMKADILRRAEEVSDSEEEEDDTLGGGKVKGHDLAFEDELDEEGAVKVRDGEPSEDEGSESDEEDEAGESHAPTPKGPETILELAYIRDPKLFERDAQTRRSKARADLKAQTGWSDEQIEGWRIMLERNPKKDKILQKHEFAGNRPGPIVEAPTPSSSSQQRQQSPARGGRGGGRGGRGGQGGGRGRGRGRGGAGGRGGGHGGEGGSEASARERAWKDKNKASRGNHNRKRGHDKKMARVGGGDAGF